VFDSLPFNPRGRQTPAETKFTPQRGRKTFSLWDMFGLIQDESLTKPAQPRDEVQIA
jgi:hypothetical protein